jgi:PAS domain-containing protein
LDDLFSVEQAILDEALSNIDSANNANFAELAKAYGKLLKQLRQTTRLSDRMTKVLNELKTKSDEQNTIITDRNSKLNMEIMMYELANRALSSGLWEMLIDSTDPMNPDNEMIFSDQFRSILGYSDETNFPNILSSCSGSIHPEDKENVMTAFQNHIQDKSGHTTFDIECRLRLNNDEYKWFRFICDTIRDDDGQPFRVAGLLLDINDHKEFELLQQKTIAADYESKIRDEQFKAVTAMSITANHEINQHLTIIQLSYEILRSKQKWDTLSEKEQNYWNKFETAIAGIERTLDKYITHSKNMKFQEYLDNVQMVTFEE